MRRYGGIRGIRFVLGWTTRSRSLLAAWRTRWANDIAFSRSSRRSLSRTMKHHRGLRRCGRVCLIEESQKPLKDGEVLQIPREKVLSAKVTGTTVAKPLTVHIVDKGKPLVEPVKR